MGDTVDNRVSHVYVRRRHVDLRAEHFLSVRVLAVAHFLKELHVLFDAPVSVWRLLARFGKGSSCSSYFISAVIADEGESFLDQRNRALVHLIEVVRSP